MKRNKMIVLGLVILVIIACGIFFVGRGANEAVQMNTGSMAPNTDEPSAPDSTATGGASPGSGGASAGGAKSGESSTKAGMWTCPMHPVIRRLEAGRCPICGMDLVPASQAKGNAPARP